MAIGEAACVSVHGANRLGSNSLIDLVVFGRAAGLRCAERSRPADAAELPPKARPTGARPPRQARATQSGDPPVADLRLEMQRVMQNNCAVFRTGEVLEEGVDADQRSLGKPAGIKSRTAR
jgi:succinate dehydrogenase/fumarate reductase flavoprotein subunit